MGDILMWNKVAALSLLFIITLLSGIIPIAISLYSRRIAVQSRMRIFGILNCFAGGVFLGLSLLDLLPDVIEDFQIALGQVDVKFPIAEASVVTGLLLILVFEQTLLAARERCVPRENGQDDEEGRLLPDGGNIRGFGTLDEIADGDARTDNGAENEIREEHSKEGVANRREVPESDGQIRARNAARANVNAGDHHEEHPQSILHSILLLVVLSFHSILEGLIVGIRSNKSKLWSLTGGIAIHKSVTAFVLSTNFLLTMRKRNAFLCLVVFALMSPIGTITGMLIERYAFKDFSKSLCKSILEGIATGTFLYVTFFELLPREIESRRDKLGKVLSIIIGVGIVCGLVAYETKTE